MKDGYRYCYRVVRGECSLRSLAHLCTFSLRTRCVSCHRPFIKRHAASHSGPRGAARRRVRVHPLAARPGAVQLLPPEKNVSEPEALRGLEVPEPRCAALATPRGRGVLAFVPVGALGSSQAWAAFRGDRASMSPRAASPRRGSARWPVRRPAV